VLLSGAFLLLLILAGIIIAISGGGGGHHTTSNPPPTQGTTTSSSTPAANSTACTLPAGDQTIPSASPPGGTTWNQLGSMQAPQARSTLGPQHTNGVWNTCFAHSPSGALLAAFNLWAESTAAPSGQVYRHLAIDVPAPAYQTATRLDDQGPVQFAGFKYQSYTSRTAQLQVVIKGPHGAFEAVVTVMRWVDGDWRYVFPPGGTPATQTLTDLTGYVPWSAF
jgi:hypothetical protein